MKEGSWNDFAASGFAIALENKGWVALLERSENSSERRIAKNVVEEGLNYAEDWASVAA